MDKESVITFLNNYYINNQVTEDSIDKLITSYCKEFKKDPYKTKILIVFLKQAGLINYSIKEILDYYINKYQIYTLYKSSNYSLYNNNSRLQNQKIFIKFY